MSDTRFKLLLVDDDDLVVSAIRMALPSHWRLTHSADPNLPPKGSFHAAFVDMHLTNDLKKAEGLNIVSKLHLIDPHLEIVAISGDIDRELMEAGLKAGATRFLSKPLSSEEMTLTLEKIEALHLLREASMRPSTGVKWVGTSDASRTALRAIADLKGEPGPILLEGESGTGKEVAASLIHAQESGNRPFITVNLGALPDSVFESEFFGHVRGAFTGADQNKMGLAEAAHGGDLFLDEVEALPAVQQAKLLRFLESGEVRRVGAKDAIRVQVRIIAATNQNLETMVKEGKFREDLLWRLNGRKVLLPALRTRRDDIPALASYFMERERPRRNKQLAEDAVEVLSQHAFPGNIRELKRICEQLSLYSPLPIIRREDVLRVIPGASVTAPSGSVILSQGLSALMGQYEAHLIRQALQQRSEIDDAAELLGISRSSLYKKIKDYNIEPRG